MSPYNGLLGNCLAHYDKALFSLLAPVIAPLLFRQQDPLTALILTYSLLTVSIVARPMGALFFGWLCDYAGRIQALCYSLTGIAVATLAMGSLAMICQLGTLSPFWMLLIRAVQSFCAAGESTNGAIFVLEQTPAAKQNGMSSYYDAAATAGWLLASALVALLTEWGHLDTHWPWLCVLGGFVGLYGLKLRGQALIFPSKPAIFSKESTPLSKVSLLAFLRIKQQRVAFFALIAAAGFSYTTYTVAFMLMNGYIPLISQINLKTIAWMNVLLISLDIVLSPCFGYLANRWGHRRQMLWAAIAMMISGVPIFYLLQQASLLTVTISRLLIVALGIAFAATYHAWAQTLVPAEARGRVISLAYALGSQLIGVPSAAVSLWLYQKTTWVGAPAFYLVLAAMAAAFAVNTAKPILNPSLQENHAKV